MRPSISVLHVDDDAAFGDLVTMFLEREDDRLDVATETSAEAALERLTDGPDVDCVVSDYDMPGLDGVEFLEAVRDSHPELPFVLFTGKGSEEVASEAISAGATDYLQKRTGTEQYELLANRIRNVVSQYRASRERARVYQALETATQGIGIIDEEGIYRYLNEAYAELYGYEPEEVVGTHWDRLYPSEEVERFQETILPEVESAGQWRGRSRGLGPNDEPFPERLSLTQLEDGGHVCVVQDVSERQESERERRRNERRFEALFEDPNLLIGILEPDGTVRDVNRTALEYLDVGCEAVRGEQFWETPWWLEEDEPDLREWIRRAADGEYVEYSVTHRSEDGSNGTFSVEGTIRPVTDESGDVVSLVASARETTERDERERRLERQNERFDELASVIDHDLGGPMQAVRGRLELAAETGDPEHLDAAERALDSIDALVSDLVSVLRSRGLVDNAERLAVASLAREAWMRVDAAAGASLAVDGDPTIEGDRDATVRLLQNLLSNAVEHGPDDVTVRVGAVPGGFYVEDSGPGIDADDREDVFTAGYTTKSDGSGIGMASVRRVADAHGWGIDVADGDRLGGARFEVTD